MAEKMKVARSGEFRANIPEREIKQLRPGEAHIQPARSRSTGHKALGLCKDLKDDSTFVQKCTDGGVYTTRRNRNKSNKIQNTFSLFLKIQNCQVRLNWCCLTSKKN